MARIDRLVEDALERGSILDAVNILDSYIKGLQVTDIKLGGRDEEFEDVRAFHLTFRQIAAATPTHLTKRKLVERANFMLEELVEFAHASGLVLDQGPNGALAFAPDDDTDQDMELQADSLIDLVYVAKGTGVMMGLPWKPLWDDVQRANMAKELGPTHRTANNPGQFLQDVRKPAGWVPPHTGMILGLYGYSRSGFVDEKGFISDEKCLDDAQYKGVPNVDAR